MNSIMLPSWIAAGLVLVAGNHQLARGCGIPQSAGSADALAHEANSPDKARAASAVSQLRALGPSGLDAVLRFNASLIERHKSGAKESLSQKDLAEWRAVSSTLDAVSRQCDSYASGLYWFDDFEKAKAAARASGKPILSLRLLGNLDEEYSCANSCFFRTTLYPNRVVSTYLRDHFILHWQSVRPVPRLTIDFGDGRKLERTITGNSVHYVLDPDGEPVDALPGLYGPKAFLKGLVEAEKAALTYARLADSAKQEYLRKYHEACGAEIVKQWNTDISKMGLDGGTVAVPQPIRWTAASPSALTAGRLAVSKSAFESPVLNSIQRRKIGNFNLNGDRQDQGLWSRIGALHEEDTQLDEVARELVLNKSALPALSELTSSKRLVEDSFLRTWSNLHRTITEDTVRNEFVLHARVHQWFVQGVAPHDLAGLNAKVYAELFLMPESDPWLGLVPANVFSALPNDGLVPPVP